MLIKKVVLKAFCCLQNLLYLATVFWHQAQKERWLYCAQEQRKEPNARIMYVPEHQQSLLKNPRHKVKRDGVTIDQKQQHRMVRKQYYNYSAFCTKIHNQVMNE